MSAKKPAARASNRIKNPDDWVTGDEEMTGAQESYLHTFAQEAHEDVEGDLTKAEASKKIDRLKEKTGRGTRRARRGHHDPGRAIEDFRATKMTLLAGWLFHSIRLAAALGLALLAMQAPAATREYQAALLQLLRSSDQEIAQRKTSAQRFYGIASDEDEARFLSQLRAVEPSNAETLAAALDRQRSLRASYDRIEGSPVLLRPIEAAKDVAADDGGARRRIAQTVFDSFAPQLDLSLAAAVYGLFGLFLGSLIGELYDRRSASAPPGLVGGCAACLRRWRTAIPFRNQEPGRNAAADCDHNVAQL